MSTTADAAVQPHTSSLKLTSGQLPPFTVPAVFVVSLAVSAAVLRLTGNQSWAGTLVVGALVGVIAVYVISRGIEGRRRALDRTMRNLIVGSFLLAVIPLVSLIVSTFGKGLARFDAKFFSQSMRNVVGAGGGAVHALDGTLIVTGMATLMSVPIGLLTAIYLIEYHRGGPLGRSIRFFVDVMTGVPSIVAGLFAYSLFALLFGPGTVNAFAGSVALSVLMIPTVVRSAEEYLRLVPNELREASYALGVPKWRTIMKVVLPTSLGGLVTGVVLAIARVIGETAPLLITMGTTDSLNVDPFHDAMATLPVYVYYQYTQPGVPADAFINRAWAGALTLVIIVMALNLIGRLIAYKFAPKTR